MTAGDARQNAADFYKEDIKLLIDRIEAVSIKGELSIRVDSLPLAVESYFKQEGFGVEYLYYKGEEEIYICWAL